MSRRNDRMDVEPTGRVHRKITQSEVLSLRGADYWGQVSVADGDRHRHRKEVLDPRVVSGHCEMISARIADDLPTRRDDP